MLENRKILLVEDDVDLRIIFSGQLKDLKSSIVIAHSGNEAIRLLEAGLQVDFIVSDYSMADGDGVAVLEYAARNNLSIPFVFYTNNINPDIPVKYERFLGTIHKFDFDQLVEVISENQPDSPRKIGPNMK